MNEKLAGFQSAEYRLAYKGRYVDEINTVLFDDKSLLIHPNYIAEPPEVKLPVTPRGRWKNG